MAVGSRLGVAVGAGRVAVAASLVTTAATVGVAFSAPSPPRLLTTKMATNASRTTPATAPRIFQDGTAAGSGVGVGSSGKEGGVGVGLGSSGGGL